MKIAQVAPLYESVPPKYYGGTERVVSYLTEELLRQGHQVTLFASGDSVTRAKLVAPWPHALRLDDQCVDQLAPHMVLLQQVFQQEHEAHPFDLIHFHIDYLHYPLTMQLHTPHVTTLHGPLIQCVGELGEGQKDDFLGQAYALLFPIDWPEPFGLVMIEALACGTPVIAYRRGSVPEVLEDGVTGWLVEGLEEAVQAVA